LLLSYSEGVELDGKVAIVTGGAGGIGSAVTRAFVGQGVGVAIADMDGPRAAELADDVSAGGGNAIWVEAEVTSEESVISAVRRTVDQFGRVDFLVHCAGNNVKGAVLDLSVEDWSRVLDTHLTGAFLFSKWVGRHLVDRGEGGRVVFMSSVAATAPVPERGAYSPAKAGLIGLVGVLSLEWAEYNINVNAVCPGMVMTPMTEMVYKRDPSLRAQRLKRMPARREAYPEEIADLVLFLCSDKANHINGTAIPIDGAFLNNGFMVEPD
jgi:NAD(P)-dependent dehydrogenase (short-subunit alcohol dehydrogenase family)